jgi:hypothetical protein
MKYFEKCKGSKGKIFASFAPFARLRTHLTTAAFSAALLTTAMLIAALFFASCGDSGASEDIADSPPPPAPKLKITPGSQYIVPGGQTSITVTFNGKSIPASEAELKVSGQLDEATSISGNNLVVGEDHPVGQLSISGKYNGTDGTAVVKVIKTNASTTSIKEKFGIPTASDDTLEAKKAAVTETFNALHEFIQAGGLTNENTSNLIALGDYIDLEGGLTVEAYTTGGGGFSYPGTSEYTRLIVVGINSFDNVNENNTQHIVFHFQNIPVQRRMNDSNNNTGGYPASEMRKYLAPVEDDEGSGKFLAGLTAAGVPEGVLWGPKRVMGTKLEDPKTKTINDLLWLPTERELFKDGEDGDGSSHSDTNETEGNQAGLEYYTNANENGLRKKQFGASDAAYWMASASNSGGVSFCSVTNGGVDAADAGATAGCAPAFCVY